jgi:hypothetical protein
MAARHAHLTTVHALLRATLSEESPVGSDVGYAVASE